MSHVILTLGNEAVGSVTFDQPEKALLANRTASGFRVYLAASVTFHPPQESQLVLLLENLQATFSASGVEIGVAHYSAALRSSPGERSIIFNWDWTLTALAVYERVRAGLAPEFSIRLSGDIRYILPGQGGKEVCSIASTFAQPGFVRYSREAWTDMLRELNLRDTVLVEIPFQADPPSGWEPIWQALRDARDSFDTGGSTGWKNCVASVRHALEEWQKVEKEEQGPGWQRPAFPDLQSRTKAQRIDNLRWHLIQCAHLAPHTKADDWTRDDALLALSTLCALLAVRKP
jgi:hypothetical protein